jgi:hypothetical protein
LRRSWTSARLASEPADVDEPATVPIRNFKARRSFFVGRRDTRTITHHAGIK